MLTWPPPKPVFPDNLRTLERKVAAPQSALALKVFEFLFLEARVHQRPEYRRVESPTAVPNLLNSDKFAGGRTGAWGRRVCVSV